MKRLFGSGGFILIAAVFCSLVLPTVSPAADPIKLKVSTWVNKMSPMGQSVLWWADEVKKRTNGQSETEIFFDQQLATAAETLQITRSGGVDVGGIVPSFHSKDMPLNHALGDAWDFKGYGDRAYIATRIYKEVPALVDEMRKNNLVLLTHVTLPVYPLWSTKPIRKPEDLKGLRVRTWSNEYPKRFTAFGGVPTSVLMAEAYEAMAKGLLDANPLPMGDALTTGLYEISKYAVVKPYFLISFGHALFMNLDRWNKLSPDLQKTLMDIRDDSAVAFVKLNKRIDVEAKKEIETKSKGKLEFVSWSDADAALWHDNVRKLSDKYLHEYLPTIGQKENGELLWNKLNELSKEYDEWVKTPEGKGYFD